MDVPFRWETTLTWFHLPKLLPRQSLVGPFQLCFLQRPPDRFRGTRDVAARGEVMRHEGWVGL